MFQMGIGVMYIAVGRSFFEFQFNSIIPFLPDMFTMGFCVSVLVLISGAQWLKALIMDIKNNLSSEEFTSVYRIYIPLILPSASILLIDMSAPSFTDHTAFVYLGYSMSMTMVLLNLILATLTS